MTTLRILVPTLLLLLQAHAVAGQSTLVEVLSQGSPFRGAFGLAFDARDRLHVASALGREIVVLDPDTGVVLERLGTGQGVEVPDDLTFGPDGSLYWTEIFTGVVGRLSPRGEVSKQFVGPFVNAIAFSDDGRLFVSQCTGPEPSGLFELDPELATPPRLVTDSLHPNCALNSMDFGPDGFLYGPRFFSGDVARVDVDTGELTLLGEGLRIPSAVKLDSRGRLHVIENATGEVSRLSLESGEKTVLATLEPGIDGMAFDSLDRLFVSRNIDGEITRILEDGSIEILRAGGLIAPGGTTAIARPDGGESIFVADLTSLTEIDGATGETLGLEISNDRAPLRRPFTVAQDADRLLISSWFDNAVQVWNPRTRRVEDEWLDFAVPMNALRFRGDLVVLELLTGSVVRVTGPRSEERETLATNLLVPAGMAATEEALWVGDFATGVVWQIAAGGTILDPPVALATGLDQPEGLAVDLDGSLLVVESGAGRVSRIDPATGEVSELASGFEIGATFLPDFGSPTVFLSGVTVAPSGDVYVTGDAGRQLYRIERSAAGCVLESTAPCLLDGRFRVTLDWRGLDPSRGPANRGRAEALTILPNPSLVFFFDPQLQFALGFLQIRDRCAERGHFEVLFVSKTRRETWLGLNDTRTGAFSSLHFPARENLVVFTDEEAFPCP